MRSNKPKLLVILGPTAIGKSRLAVEIAKRINAEILSADSLQVYRHLDIGTAKPSEEDRTDVVHHLLDIIDPDQEFNAGVFRQHADPLIRERAENGTKFIVVGGTYLYVRVLLHGLIAGTAANREIRQRLRLLKSAFGIGYFYEKLKSVDPESASRIHPNDYVRIERALESYCVTGEKISDLQKKHGFRDSEYSYLKIGLYDDRDLIKLRIEERVDSMIRDGFVGEVEAIRNMGFEPTLKPLQSIGYRQINQYLDNDISLENAVELMKRDTRRLAKRQMTWLRQDDGISWHRVPLNVDSILPEVRDFFA